MNTEVPTTKKGFNLYQAVTDRIIELLEEGVIPWRKPWSSAGPPMNADTKRPYSGINHLLLLSLPYDSNLYLTFEQVKNLGGHVNKGEKGHMVVLWLLLKGSDGNEPEETHKTIPFLRYYRVFNVEQCSNLPSHLLESGYERQVNPVAVCEGIVQGMPNAPEIRFGRSVAYYHPKHDYINMPLMKRFNDTEGYYGTLFHEMVHSTGHPSRLNRKGVSDVEKRDRDIYSFEELVAELGSSFLCSHTGIDQKVLKNQAAYVKGWLSKLKGDNRQIVYASAQAQKAVDYILCRSGDVTTLRSINEHRA